MDGESKMRWLQKQFKEVEDTFTKALGPKERCQRSTIRHHAWEPPGMDWIKVNTDGCSIGKGRKAGCGGVMRDGHASFLGAFANCIGSCEAFEAEVWGIYQGLQVAWNKGYRRIIIESDCALAVESLTRDKNMNGLARNIIDSCKSLMKRSWEVRVYHVPREHNRVADALAKMATQNDWGFCYLQEPPRNITRLLREDELGLLRARTTVRTI